MFRRKIQKDQIKPLTSSFSGRNAATLIIGEDVRASSDHKRYVVGWDVLTSDQLLLPKTFNDLNAAHQHFERNMLIDPARFNDKVLLSELFEDLLNPIQLLRKSFGLGKTFADLNLNDVHQNPYYEWERAHVFPKSDALKDVSDPEVILKHLFVDPEHGQAILDAIGKYYEIPPPTLAHVGNGNHIINLALDQHVQNRRVRQTAKTILEQDGAQAFMKYLNSQGIDVNALNLKSPVSAGFYDARDHTIHVENQELVVLLHEAAHAVVAKTHQKGTYQQHGPEFTRVAIQIFDRFGNKDIQSLVDSAKAAGLFGQRQVTLEDIEMPVYPFKDDRLECVQS